MKKIIAIILTVVLCFALSVSALAGTYTAPAAKAITLDGVITEDEWGTPVFKGVTPNQAVDRAADAVSDFWFFDTSYSGNENFDLYVNNDSENIYLGVVMHETVIDSASMGINLWQYQNFTFTIAKADGSGVPAIEFEGQQYEQYTGFRIGMKADGSILTETLTQGIDAVNLSQEQYKVVYDEAAKTMTYEVAVPYSMTNIDISETTSMAFSAVLPLQNVSNGKSGQVDGANRFLIGTAAAFCGGPGNFAHNGQTITIELNGPDAVTGITGTLAEVTEQAEPETEEAAPEEEATATTEETSLNETTVIERVEKELVWKATPQMIIITASGVVVLASIVVIILSLTKKKVKEEVQDSTED